MKKAVIAFAICIAAASSTQAQLVASHAPTRAVAPKSVAPLNPGKVVARVNGAQLTEIDLNRAMSQLFPYERMHGNKVPEKFSSEIRTKALNQIIFEELVYQEGERRKIPVPMSMIRDVEQQARSRFATQAEYDAFIRNGYGNLQGFERQVRRGILIAKVIDSDITQRAQMSDARLREFYTKRKTMFVKPESIAIQSITVNIPDNPTAEQVAAAKKRAEAILPKAKAAKNYEEFGTLAEKVSEDEWRVMMGDHKWIHRGRLSAAVEKAVFALKPQQTSDIIETKEALIIVRVNGYEPQKQLSFEEVKDAMRSGLEQEATAKLRADLEQRLHKTAKVEVL